MWTNLVRRTADSGMLSLSKQFKELVFRRGNPLHLQPEIYRKLQRLWNYQEVAEEVVNQYDMNHRNMNFDWHHF